MRQKVFQSHARLFQDLLLGQIDDAEIARFGHIETRSVRDQNMLLLQKIYREFLVVANMYLLRVDLREDVKRRVGSDNADTVDRGESSL